MSSYIGSICAPDKASLKAEAHALQCTTAGPHNAIPTGLLGVGSVCGFGPDLVGIHSVSLAARYRTAACSNTLNQGLEKIQAARAFDFAPILALSPNWEKDFLAPSMARSTAVAFNIVRRLDHDGKLDEVSQDKKQKVATSQLCDKITYTGFCWTNLLAGLQGSRTDQPLSNCGHSVSHETCVACLSSWARCWFSAHPLQRAMSRLKDFTQ